ncbi:MAG: hypothetical protein WCG85_20055 [Polyangia bacterium]
MRKPRFANPARFALGVAVPARMEDWARREDGQARDLARVSTSVSDTEQDLALLARAVVLAGRIRVRVHMDLRSSQLDCLFRNADVVTLVAHAPSRDSIELFDTEITRDRLVESIPVGFDGCLDLTMCRSETLAEQIRFARGCLVVGHKLGLGLRQGLMVYLQTLLTVIERPRPYFEVLSDLLIDWTEDLIR